MFSGDTQFSLQQTVELLALVPCFFVVVLLCLQRGDRLSRVVPVLYFLSIAAGLLVPLLDMWTKATTHEEAVRVWEGAIIFFASLQPALTFLLILQWVRRRPPEFTHWLILALPVIGGGPVVYASFLSDEICMQPWGCFYAADIENLYAIFATSLIFLLLSAWFVRKRKSGLVMERQQYWLVISLIGLNLLLFTVRLLRVGEYVEPSPARVISSLLQLSFIYIVLTAMFRVGGMGATRQSRRTPEQEAERAQALCGQFRRMMEEERFYLRVECNREAVARRLGINENYLSRIINQEYGRRFTEIINAYRIREAEKMLCEQPGTSITGIAFAVGFNSIPSFNRVFKEMKGMSPRQFRARHHASGGQPA